MKAYSKLNSTLSSLSEFSTQSNLKGKSTITTNTFNQNKIMNTNKNKTLKSSLNKSASKIQSLKSSATHKSKSEKTSSSATNQTLSKNKSKLSAKLHLKSKMLMLAKMRLSLKARSQSKSTSQSQSKSTAQIKSKITQVPFNVAMPWGEMIASQLGTTLDELKANLPADPTLTSAVQSTCALVRDQAVKTLAVKNRKALTGFKDICQGSGQVLNEKKLTMTGGCKWVKGPKEGTELGLGDGVNEIVGTCANVEAAFVFKRNQGAMPSTSAPVKKPTFADRLNQRTSMSLGGTEPPVFLQTGSQTHQTSNDEIPMQTNSTLSGKGFTMNAKPLPRNVTSADKQLFHESYKEGGDAAEAEEAAKEEESAIGGSTDAPLLSSDADKPVMAMAIPEWFCPIICAGLDLDYLFEGQNIETEPQTPVPKTPTPVPSMGGNPDMIGEENVLINTGRFGVDPKYTVKTNDQPTAEVDEAPDAAPSKDMNGHYKCAGVLPVALDCLEKGDLIAEWFIERILNNKVMCDYNTGSCNSLFGG